MNQSIVTVTIGRNVKDVPMSDSDWTAFRAGVELILSAVGEKGWTQKFEGRGEWDGVEEDSAIFTRIYPEFIPSLDFEKRALRILAQEFGQDAIAFSHGQSELIES